MGAWAGGVAQGISSRNAANMQKEANNELTRRMELARRAYASRRPQVNSQKFDALQQQMGMFNPVIGMMGEMTGGRYAPNISGITNPVKVTATMADLAGGVTGKVDGKEGKSIMPEDMSSRAQREALARLSGEGYDTTALRGQITKDYKGPLGKPTK